MVKADPRPYWQRQRYTVQGWIGHRASVQAWKKRNPERHNVHNRKVRLVAKEKYGKSDARDHETFIERASRWNEAQGL